MALPEEFYSAGHRCTVRLIEPCKFWNNQEVITVSCRPQCCTQPFGMTIVATEADIVQLIQVARTRRKSRVKAARQES